MVDEFITRYQTGEYSIPMVLKIYNVTFYITEEKVQTPNYPDSLQQVALTLLDPATCRDQVDGYRYGVVVTDKMICAGRDVNGYGVCEVSDVVYSETSLAIRDFCDNFKFQNHLKTNRHHPILSTIKLQTRCRNLACLIFHCHMRHTHESPPLSL